MYNYKLVYKVFILVFLELVYEKRRMLQVISVTAKLASHNIYGRHMGYECQQWDNQEWNDVNKLLSSCMQITWSWPPVGRLSHDLITLRQKETWI